MRTAVVGMVLLCGIAQGAEPKSVTNSIGMELIKISAGKFVMGKERRAVNAGLLEGKTLTEELASFMGAGQRRLHKFGA